MLILGGLEGCPGSFSPEPGDLQFNWLELYSGVWKSGGTSLPRLGPQNNAGTQAWKEGGLWVALMWPPGL